MGIGPGYRSRDVAVAATPTTKTAPNPNPWRGTIMDMKQCGDQLVAKVRYPDADNYEGVKIMVYRDLTMLDLASSLRIVPHFVDPKDGSSQPVPFARFEPTE